MKYIQIQLLLLWWWRFFIITRVMSGGWERLIQLLEQVVLVLTAGERVQIWGILAIVDRILIWQSHYKFIFTFFLFFTLNMFSYLYIRMGFKITIWIILNQIIWIWLLVISYYRWHSWFIDKLISRHFIFQIVYMLINLFIFNSLAIISAVRRYNSLNLINARCQSSILVFLLRTEVTAHCFRPLIFDLFQMSANIIRIMKHIHINIFYLVQYIAHPIWFLLPLGIGSFSTTCSRVRDAQKFSMQRLFAFGIILSVKVIAFQFDRVPGR